jgi:hypothetical protein
MIGSIFPFETLAVVLLHDSQWLLSSRLLQGVQTSVRRLNTQLDFTFVLNNSFQRMKTRVEVIAIIDTLPCPVC